MYTSYSLKRSVFADLQNTVDMTMNVFNWQRVLKYCMDIQTMLMAKMGESDASEDPSTDASTGRSAGEEVTLSEEV